MSELTVRELFVIFDVPRLLATWLRWVILPGCRRTPIDTYLCCLVTASELWSPLVVEGIAASLTGVYGPLTYF